MQITHLGEYTIEACLGEGAMACVYRAIDTRTQAPVAIKIPRFDSEENRANVLAEARLSIQLQHPRIVRVYDVREFDGELAIIMELVEGDSLHHRIRAAERLGVEETLWISAQIADALDAAHRAGVLHRDIKPENIMVEADLSVRVMDFGIAQRVDPDQLSTSQRIAGTAMYMSPEQAMGALLDEHSDLYSLGAVMYEMVTGHPPFEGDNLISLLYRHINEMPLPPARQVPGLPVELSQLILRLLSKAPQDRPASAAVLCDQLEAFLENWRRDGRLTDATGLEDEGILGTPLGRLTGMLVGREEETEKLLALLERSGDQPPIGGIIEGEQGIGKTHLVEQCLTKSSRLRVLRGNCSEVGASAPSFPFEQMLSQYFGSELPGELDDLLHRRETGSEAVAAEEAHHRLLQNLTETLAAIGQEAPTCLLIEDFQHADSTSLELLQLSCTQPTADSPILLLTYTPGEVGSDEGMQPVRVAQMLDELSEQGLLERIVLERFGESEVAQLVGSLFELADFEEAFTTRLHEETEGNPLFVVETIAWLQHEGTIAQDPLGVWSLTQPIGSIEIPDRVTDLLRQRLRGLSSEQRELLECASVSEGDLFDAQMLSVLLDLPGLVLLDRLGSLEHTHRLIVSVGNRYRFDHVKLKYLIHAEIPEERRKSYHLSLARFWEDADPEASVYTLAYHYEQAGHVEKAREFLVKAAQNDERLYTSDRAVEYYRRALAYTPGDSFQYLEILQRIAWLQSHLLGEVDQAIEAYAQIASLAEQRRDLKQQAEAIKQLGNLYAVRGEWSASGRSYEQSREIFEQLEDERQVGNIWMNLGLNHFETGSLEEAFHCFAAAQRIAEPIEDRELLGDAYRGFGMVHALQQNRQEAIRCYQTSIESYQQAGSLRYLAQTQLNLGMLYSDEDDLERADRYYADSEQSARDTGNVRFLGFVCLNRASLLSEQQPARAKELCDEALNLLRKADDRSGMLAAYRIYGQIYAALEQWDLAVRCVRTSIELAEQGNHQLDIADGYRDLGQIFLRSGEREQACSALQQAADVYQELGAEEPLQEIQAQLAES